MEIATKKYENHLCPLNLKKPFYEEALLFTVPFEFEEVNLKNCQFLENLKLIDITPVFKKEDKN